MQGIILYCKGNLNEIKEFILLTKNYYKPYDYFFYEKKKKFLRKKILI